MRQKTIQKIILIMHRIAAYSNSKPIALAYASIFESLWKQTELHQKLSKMYEELRIHDKMQKEFIDIASI